MIGTSIQNNDIWDKFESLNIFTFKDAEFYNSNNKICIYYECFLCREIDHLKEKEYFDTIKIDLEKLTITLWRDNRCTEESVDCFDIDTIIELF